MKLQLVAGGVAGVVGDYGDDRISAVRQAVARYKRCGGSVFTHGGITRYGIAIAIRYSDVNRSDTRKIRGSDRDGRGRAPHYAERRPGSDGWRLFVKRDGERPAIGIGVAVTVSDGCGGAVLAKRQSFNIARGAVNSVAAIKRDSDTLATPDWSSTSGNR